MSKPGEEYTKEISPFYTKIPDKVHFMDQQFVVKKTWKIGNKSHNDMTRDEYIKKIEMVDILDVNQYNSKKLE